MYISQLTFQFHLKNSRGVCTLGEIYNLEAGLREVHCTRAQQVRVPGKVTVVWWVFL